LQVKPNAFIFWREEKIIYFHQSNLIKFLRMNSSNIVETDMMNKFKGLWRLIGNTPLLEIEFLYKGEKRKLYAKSEQYNITGSIKDRMALHVLESAYRTGRIKPGDRIAEATSGNTGIAFAAIGKALGHPVTIFMPDWMSKERVDIIRGLGAEIVPVSHEQGGFLGSIRLSEELAKSKPNIFLPCQFANPDNVMAHFKTTGPEIWEQMAESIVIPDAFVAGVGTGGTIMGVGGYLKTKNPKIKLHPMEPAESPTLTTGYKVGKHRIQGISDEFIPKIVKLNELDEIIMASDGDGIIMAQKLACELGLAVGISSGANFIAALKVQNSMGRDANVVTVFSDCNKKYLSTDLLRKEPAKHDYLSCDIKLISFKVNKRVCEFCDKMFDLG
jgi:cysteine synthase A